MKIGVVSVPATAAASLVKLLLDCNHTVAGPVDSAPAVLSMLTLEAPELLIVAFFPGVTTPDLRMVRYLRKRVPLPILFAGVPVEPGVLLQLMAIVPDACLVGAFSRKVLRAALGVALHNYAAGAADRSLLAPPLEVLVIREGQQETAIPFTDILYCYSNHVYVAVVTPDRKLTIRGALGTILSRLPADRFCRVHRGFIVNTDHVTSVTGSLVYIGEIAVPVSKSYRGRLRALLGDR